MDLPNLTPKPVVQPLRKHTVQTADTIGTNHYTKHSIPRSASVYSIKYLH